MQFTLLQTFIPEDTKKRIAAECRTNMSTFQCEEEHCIFPLQPLLHGVHHVLLPVRVQARPDGVGLVLGSAAEVEIRIGLNWDLYF